MLVGGEAAGGAASRLGQAGRAAWLGRAAEGTTETVGYSSFRAFKAANGSAGEGMAWHHIVEQNPSNITKFGPEAIHTESNLIKLPNGAGSIHAKISGFYSSKMPGTSMHIRDYVKTLPFQEQYQFGLDALKRFGY